MPPIPPTAGNTEHCRGCEGLELGWDNGDDPPTRSWFTRFDILEREAKAKCTHCTILWKSAAVWGDHPDVFHEEESAHDHRFCEGKEPHVYIGEIQMASKRLSLTRTLLGSAAGLKDPNEHRSYGRLDPSRRLQREQRVQIQLITLEGGRAHGPEQDWIGLT